MTRYKDTQLGKQTSYIDQYDPNLLCPIPRNQSRPVKASSQLPFKGVDLWTAYELSWLNPDGLPQLVIAEFVVPCESEFIVESKSFKLYLNSYSQTQFASCEQVKEQLIADLSDAAGILIDVTLYQISEFNGFKPIGEPQGFCIDHQPVTIECYHPNASLLQVDDNEMVEETLYSHLLKSNCPVTDQPDWGSVYISYQGPKIDSASLLKYIVSYRQQQDFHELCVENIFTDIMACCKPKKLTVYGCYLRRGGLDINPFRSTCYTRPPTSYRQVRQ